MEQRTKEFIKELSKSLGLIAMIFATLFFLGITIGKKNDERAAVRAKEHLRLEEQRCPSQKGE